jgi:hypothetical protein
MPPIEYYSNEESFSEVENAKAVLEGLCQRFRIEIQARRVASQRPGFEASGGRVTSEQHLESTVADLEKGMAEFIGTDQQLAVIRDLLFTLKKTKQFDRWTEVYLQALYEHPTHPVVADLAEEAIFISGLCGREKAVGTGLSHVNQIPFSFPGKGRIQAAITLPKSLAINEVSTPESIKPN